MSYDVIRLACDKLSYREKMKLAQYLIQAAIKEEESLNPVSREIARKEKNNAVEANLANLTGQDVIEYVKERLLKSKPSKKKSLINFINAMFQFQGGIAESNVEILISDLITCGFLRVEGNKVIYA